LTWAHSSHCVEFRRGRSFRLDAKLAKLRSQPVGTLALGFGALAFRLGALVFGFGALALGFAILEEFHVRGKRPAIRADDSQFVRSLSGLELDAEPRALVPVHVLNFFQARAAAQPAREVSVIGIVNDELAIRIAFRLSFPEISSLG